MYRNKINLSLDKKIIQEQEMFQDIFPSPPPPHTKSKKNSIIRKKYFIQKIPTPIHKKIAKNKTFSFKINKKIKTPNSNVLL